MFKKILLAVVVSQAALLSGCMNWGKPLPPIEPYPYPIPGPESRPDGSPVSGPGTGPRTSPSVDPGANRGTNPGTDPNTYPNTGSGSTPPDQQGSRSQQSGSSGWPNSQSQRPASSEPIPEQLNVPESNNSAVMALVKQSDTMLQVQEYKAAGAQLERALRIEPRNHWLSYRLANLRLLEGQDRQAESFAFKSLRLAEVSNLDAYSKRKLKFINWQLIRNARSQRGDSRGADQAESRSRDYII